MHFLIRCPANLQYDANKAITILYSKTLSLKKQAQKYSDLSEKKLCNKFSLSLPDLIQIVQTESKNYHGTI
jgi:hypothetical protein